MQGKNINNILSVGLDGDLKRIDLELLSCEIICSPSIPLNKVDFDENRKIIFLCGWDEKLISLDMRKNNMNRNNINLVDTNMHISNFIFSGEKLIVAGVDKTNTNLIRIFDLRNISKSLKTYESPLKFPTSALCASNTVDGFIIGSVEGKIALEFFEDSLQNERQDKNKTLDNQI